VGILTSHNPIGLHGPLHGQLYFFCVVFIVCNVFFIVCVALCAVLLEHDVLFCVMCVFLCLTDIPLPPGENQFAVQLNNANIKTTSASQGRDI
jgi:hypothetical protein